MNNQDSQENPVMTEPSSYGSPSGNSRGRENSQVRYRWEPKKGNHVGQSAYGRGNEHKNGRANGNAYKGRFQPPIINAAIQGQNNNNLFSQPGHPPGTASCGPLFSSYFLGPTAPVHNAGSSIASGVAQDDNRTGPSNGIHAMQFSGSSDTSTSIGYNSFIPDGRALQGNSRLSEQPIVNFGHGSIVDTNSNHFPEYRCNDLPGQIHPPFQQDFRYQHMLGQYSSMNAFQGHGPCFEQSSLAQDFSQAGCQNFPQAQSFFQNTQVRPWAYHADQQQGSTLSFSPIQDASAQSNTTSLASSQIGGPTLEDKRRQQTNKEKMIRALREGHEL